MKNEKFPQVIFTDEKYVNQMIKEINSSKVELQKLLNLSVDLTHIETYKELFRLIQDPGYVYKDAGVTNQVPDDIRIQASVCRGIEHIGRLDMWIIKDYEILINETELQRFAHINDIVVQNEAQAIFARDCIEFARLSNHLTDTIAGLPTGRMMGEPFTVTASNYFTVLKKVELQKDYLQELLKFVL